MGCGATIVGHENRDTAGVDRHSEEGLSLPHDDSADRCDQTAGDVTSVPAVELANGKAEQTEAAAQVGQSEIVLHDLWFALSRKEQLQFGGQFSRMLLRAVELQVTSPTNESESNS